MKIVYAKLKILIEGGVEMLSLGNRAMLKQRDLLDTQGHPKTEAFEIAINTVSADSSSLCKELWTHSNECEICSQRANEALKKAYGE